MNNILYELKSDEIIKFRNLLKNIKKTSTIFLLKKKQHLKIDVTSFSFFFKNGPIEIYTNGNNTSHKDSIYLEDTVKKIDFLLQNLKHYNIKKLVFKEEKILEIFQEDGIKKSIKLDSIYKSNNICITNPTKCRLGSFFINKNKSQDLNDAIKLFSNENLLLNLNTPKAISLGDSFWLMLDNKDSQNDELKGTYYVPKLNFFKESFYISIYKINNRLFLKNSFDINEQTIYQSTPIFKTFNNKIKNIDEPLIEKLKFTTYSTSFTIEDLIETFEGYDLSLDYSNKKIKYYSFNFYDDSKFCTIKVTNKNYYTFTFYDINYLEEKINITKIFLQYLKSLNLLNKSKIQCLKISHFNFDNSIALLKFNTSKNKLYNKYSNTKDENVYTINPKSFRVYLNRTNMMKLFDYHKKKYGNSLEHYNDLTFKEKNDFVKKIFLKTISNLELRKDSEKDDRFYISIDSMTYESLKRKKLYIREIINKEFNPYFDNKTNYFKISHTSEIRKCSYTINRWNTRNKDYLISDEENHEFTLNDSIETIVKYIDNFLNKYKLYHLRDIELKNTYTSRTKFENNNISTTNYLKNDKHKIKETFEYLF